MYKNINIKTVYRAAGLPETNSSSSHSVCICMDENTNLKPGDPGFDLDIRDGILYVPERGEDFGWEFEKSNSCQTKLQYLCAFYFSSWAPLYTQKRAMKLTEILKKIFGVKDVVYEWVENYKEYAEREGGDDPPSLDAAPSIDHQSYSDMKAEITENFDTIKNFLLNPKSWWFGGNDNSNDIPGFKDEMCYKEPEDPELIGLMTADFGENGLGKMDFNFEFPGEGLNQILGNLSETDDYIIDSIYYDLKLKKFVLVKDNNEVTEYRYRRKDVLSSQGLYISGNKAYIVFCGGDTYNSYVMSRDISSEDKILKKIIESGKLVEGSDYILVPVRLYVPKFGELYA